MGAGTEVTTGAVLIEFDVEINYALILAKSAGQCHYNFKHGVILLLLFYAIKEI